MSRSRRQKKSNAPAEQRSPLLWPVVGGLVVLYAGIAGFNVAFGAMNVDEGFYAAAARAVWQGEVPYRDFGYTQPPLLLYVNGLVMGLTRFGLFEQRVVNGCWGLLALLLGARILWRRGLPWRAMLLVASFALSTPWMYEVHLGKTYGFVSLVIMAAVTVWLDWAAGWKKSVALSVLTVIGVGCRLPAAPFFGLLWLAALWDDGGVDLRRLAVAGTSLAGATVLLLLPFFLVAPDLLLFWIVDFHWISVPARSWQVRWEEIVALAPAVWALLLFALGAGLAARRRWPWRESALAVVTLVALAANLLPQGAYEEYGVTFLPPLAVVVFLLLPPVVTTWRAPARWLAGAAVLLLPLALIPVLCRYRGEDKRHFPSIWLPLNALAYNYQLPENIRRCRELVTRALPPGEPFYGPAIIVGVEADRPIPRRLRMGAFTMTKDFPEAEADRLHLMTYAELVRLAVSSEMRVFVMHRQPLFNYIWSVPSFSTQPPAERLEWVTALDGVFKTGRQDADFVVLVRKF